jgi:hypothetical protein
LQDSVRSTKMMGKAPLVVFDRIAVRAPTFGFGG